MHRESIIAADKSGTSHLCLLPPEEFGGADGEAMGDRLERVLRVRKVRKIYPLALELGVNESCISRWRRGGAISTENAIKLCRALDISLDWLLSGRGEMDQHKKRCISDREYVLVEKVRALPERARNSVLVLFEAIAFES